MNNILKRTITGTLFVALLVFCILFNQLTFSVLFLFVSLMGLREFHGLTNEHYHVQVSPFAAGICGGLFFVLNYFSGSCAGVLQEYEILSIYFLSVVVVLAIELFRKKENPIHDWAFFILGQVYIAVPFAMLNYIAFVPSFGCYNWLIVLAFFVVIWVYDTGAFLVGMSIGKHKMFPRVSPKKSWEGLFGGIFFALVSGFVFSYFDDTMTLFQWLGFAFAIAVSATFGDLSESLLKRNIGVKDSGNILPGHGGILDRFDSVLFASVVAVAYLSLFV